MASDVPQSCAAFFRVKGLIGSLATHFASFSVKRMLRIFVSVSEDGAPCVNQLRVEPVFQILVCVS